MAYTDLLNELCGRLGVWTHYYHPDLKKEVKADQSSKRIICRALGYPADTEKQIQRSLKKLHDEYWQDFAPPVKVALESEIKPLVLYIIVRQADQNKKLSFVLTREDGTTQAGQVSLADAQIMETAVFDSEIYLRYQIRLYLDVAQGYHSLSFLMDNQKIKSNARTRLIVVPPQCFVQESLLAGHKVWGFPLQLYALQSERNWGIGDFTDLCQMAHLSKKLGADLVGINPVNGLFLDAPDQASPYSPSSRVFLNPLYVDIEAVPEAVDCVALAEYKKSDRFQEVMSYLKANNQVDYDYVSELKLTALEILFKVFKAVHLDEKGNPLTPRGESFIAFVKEHGEQLENFATFQVLRQYLKTQGQSLLWWRWDKGYKTPNSDLIKSFQKKYADSILFVQYQQFLAFEQYAAVGPCFKEENYTVGLYTDLPVSVGENSAEVWANQKLFLHDVSVGSPPDLFNKKGQNWSLSAFNPKELKRSGYDIFIRIIKNLMKSSGAVRIDHAFGLMRLYLRVLHGKGAYLSYPFDDLMGIIALESMRNRCCVIAEDLGTPPPDFYEKMRAYRTFSFRLFRYQKNGDVFIPPYSYERMCLIASGTHDLPTYSAFWKGLDLELAKQMKTITLSQYRSDKKKRIQELKTFIQAFAQENLPVCDEIDQNQVPSWFIENTYAYLAKSNSLILLVRLEDVLEQDEQVNFPGTYLEYPNWRYKLPVYLENLSLDKRVQSISNLVTAQRK